MRRLLSTLSTLLLVAAAAAQLRIPLDGAWELAADRDGTAGTYDRTIAVPAAFETALGTEFDGAAWYRCRLPLQDSWRGAQIRVEFAAVATAALVRCNGEPVGEHLGGWTPFRVEVTGTLRWRGDDRLEVRVDELPGHDTQGFLPVIQPHFGGIWQPVTLCVDHCPVVDRVTLGTRGVWLDGVSPPRGRLHVEWNVLPFAGRGAARVRVDVTDGSCVLASATVAADLRALELEVPGARGWHPEHPHLFRARVRADDGDGTVLDTVERPVGFRNVRRDGTTIVWNGRPLVVRGILHWGLSPPHMAPPSDRAFWRRQLEDFRSLGFNTLKCCLFVPPPCVYELCDELGMVCWQEYPTWHARIDQAHKQQLLDEYGGFFALDRSHVSVAFRSITCETGHGADLDVVQSLYSACKQQVPDSLVVDDSSWLGWQRVADFWDEHPYGNNRWWPRRLQHFQQWLREHEPKPLLLGECIAGDTWVDRAEWQRRHGDRLPWWRPHCLADQARFEAWVGTQFGTATVATVAPIARDYAMRTRRYQIERLRATIPDAGYVVSVARDFGKARMGLYDDFDRLKWSADEWSWHRDAMLCLDSDQRAFVTGEPARTLGVRAARGTHVGPAVALPPLPRVTTPTRHRVSANIDELAAAWDLWLLPPPATASPANVRIADRLDPKLLAFVEAGGRLLLRVGGAPRSLRSEPLWYLRGAPWAPPHAVHRALPLPLLVDLQPFDLDGDRLMPGAGLMDQVDPILAFWESHDLAEVRSHLFAFDTRLGRGRLLASTFDRHSEAGRFAEQALLEHLATGPAPQRELTPTTIADLRLLLEERTLPLVNWRFRTDPDDAGRQDRWDAATHDASAAPWRDLAAGSHWENQAADLRHYTGIAWYRCALDVPADWAEQDSRLVLEGVDDSCEVILDGELIGTRGDPSTGATVWLEPQVFEFGRRLAPGRHVLTLRVVDHQGAGGLWKPAYVTTGPTGPARQLLQ